MDSRISGGESGRRGPWAAAWRACAFLVLPALTALAALTALSAGGCAFETRPEDAKILFLGNSITRHPPLADIGWSLRAGMAATREENDYAHQTVRILRERGLALEPRFGTRDCEICDGVIGEHLESLDDVRALRPRYVVVQLGENATRAEIEAGRLTAQYLELLRAVRPLGARRIFCLSNWGEDTLATPRNEAILRAIRHFPDIAVVDISALSRDPENYGDTLVYPDKGVAWHPGDLGMRRIAERLADAILEDG